MITKILETICVNKNVTKNFETLVITTANTTQNLDLMLFPKHSPFIYS